MNQSDIIPSQDTGSPPVFYVSGGHPSGEAANRLVKGAKSPTNRKSVGVIPRFPDIPLMGPPCQPDREEWAKSIVEADCYEPSLTHEKCPDQQAGAFTVIQFREWADEYRIFTRVETTRGTLPPDHAGPRFTSELSRSGVRKIAESCQYVAMQKGGYKTFLTLTFNQAQRAALLAGETSIQREVSRFMDSIRKLWVLGWVATDEKTGAKKRQSGRKDDLLYLWVVEVPDNKAGEPNPHVHVLLNWRVERRYFRSWAARFEKLWGHGVAHLEKIKDGGAAGSYMIKAAGYLCKAQGKTDQGTVRGNRYGMSAAARAPAWVTIEEKQLHIMGALIADLHQYITEKHGEDYGRRKALKTKLENVPKKAKKHRRHLGRELEKVRERLNSVPVVAGKYQVLFKGAQAFHEFMRWAKTDRAVNPWADWLPPKGDGENWRPGLRPDSQWYKQFKERHYWRRACRAAKRLLWSDSEWEQIRADYEHWDIDAGNPEGDEFGAFICL